MLLWDLDGSGGGWQAEGLPNCFEDVWFQALSQFRHRGHLHQSWVTHLKVTSEEGFGMLSKIRVKEGYMTGQPVNSSLCMKHIQAHGADVPKGHSGVCCTKAPALVLASREQMKGLGEGGSEAAPDPNSYWLRRGTKQAFPILF